MSKFINPQTIVDGYMFAEIDGYAILLDKMQMISVHAFCAATGSPAGTINIQVSNENGDPVTNGTATNISNWVTLATLAVSGATNAYWQGLIASKWMRVTYVPNSGTGKLEVFVFGKSYNG